MPQPVFYYELLDPDAAYPKDYHLVDLDSSKLVSCTLLKEDPRHLYDAVFQDNYGLYGKDGKHFRPEGPIVAYDHLLRASEIQRSPMRLVIPEKDYERGKKVCYLSLTVEAPATACYPEAITKTIPSIPRRPAQPLEFYAWKKDMEQSEIHYDTDTYPRIHRVEQLCWSYQGKSIQNDSYITHFGAFPNLPEDAPQGFQEALAVWQKYETFTDDLTHPDILTAKMAPPPYSKETALSHMECPAHFQKKRDKIRYYEDRAMITSYAYPDTKKGREAYATAILSCMAQDAIPDCRMPKYLIESRHPIFSTCLDLLETSPEIHQHLRAIRRQAKDHPRKEAYAR